MEELPEALLAEILSRLPVKPLLRSKSVCKNWYSLIQNPSFIFLHRHRAAPTAVTQSTDRLLVKRSLDNIILSFVPNETPFEDDLDIQLFGPCNGVVCLTTIGYDSTIALCNPWMREFRVLPQPSYKEGYLANLGFGFDLDTNDYRVVKFGYHSPHTITEIVDKTIEIYVLSTDSWRRGHVDSQIRLDLDFNCFSFTLWNGHFYWYMSCPNGDDAIVVFRMTDKVFDAKPVPEVCSLDSSKGRELFVLNDSLALVLYPSSFSMRICPLGKHFDIWVMDEEGVEVSWNKKFTVGPLQWLELSIGISAKW